MNDAVKELIGNIEIYLEARGVDWEDCDDGKCPCQKTKDLAEKIRAAIKKVREEMAKPQLDISPDLHGHLLAKRRIIRPKMIVRGNLGGK